MPHSSPLDAGLVVRRAVAADAPAIRTLVRAAYARWIPVIGREPRPMQADYSEAVARHRFVLAFVDGDLAGLIETVAKADHLWIENIAVAPERQGRGLGRRLLALADDIAAAERLPACRLLTNAAFAQNVALYRSAGFSVDRQEPFMGGWTVYMSRPVRMP